MGERVPSALDRRIGVALRRARQSRAYTQEELAGKLGIGRSALAHYESGRRQLTVALLLEAARALGLPVAMLLPTEDIADSR